MAHAQLNWNPLSPDRKKNPILKSGRCFLPLFFDNCRRFQIVKRDVFGSMAAVFFFVLVIALFPCLTAKAGEQPGDSVSRELRIQPITREEAIRIIELTPIAPPSRLLGKRLPRRVDLKREIPPVGYQQDDSMQCVIFATAYYQMSQMVKHFLHPDWDLRNPNYQFSVQFVAGEHGGGYPELVYQVLMENGCVDTAEMQFSRDVSTPTDKQLEAAKPYRIAAYAPLWNNGRGKSEYKEYPFSNPIENAKAWLADGFVISADVPASMPDFPDNHCTPPSDYYDPVDIPIDYAGGHGVAIVGYDDNINPSGIGADHKGGFLIVNEWGPTWNGDMHGYLWLSYNCVRKYMQYAWIMVPGPPDTPVVTDCTLLETSNTKSTYAIQGENFGSYRRLARVNFQGLPVMTQHTKSWTNDTIVVETDPNTCPAGSPVIVYNWNGVPSDPFYFQP